MKRAAKIAAMLIFMLYTFYMLWLLFIRSRSTAAGDYWELVRQNISLVPFRTLFQYIKSLLGGTESDEARHAFINIFGNIILFVPFGILLPFIFEKLRRTQWFLLCFGAAITLIETVQLFTLRGACDVDDLLLNTFGALIGFLIFYGASGLYAWYLKKQKP